MPIICPRCKNKTALVSGTFYYSADDEPYEADEHIELDLEGEQHIHGQYCEECEVMVSVWDDESYLNEKNQQGDSKLRDHFAGLAMQACISNPNYTGISWEDHAKASYEIADAMLKSRKEVKP